MATQFPSIRGNKLWGKDQKGDYQQILGADGKPTADRMDRGRYIEDGATLTLVVLTRTGQV